MINELLKKCKKYYLPIADRGFGIWGFKFGILNWRYVSTLDIKFIISEATV